MGCFFSLFSELLSNKKTGRRNEATEAVFFHRQLRELYEADFHKPGIYGSGRVWANAWDVFSRVPSRVGRGSRAAVDFVVYFGWGGFFRDFIFSFSSNAHGLLQL